MTQIQARDPRRAAVAPGAFAALALLGGPAHATPDELLRGAGLSFPHIQPDLGQPLEIVGGLDPAAGPAPFPLNPAHEYSWTLYGAVVHQVTGSPGVTVRDLTLGFLEIRDDPSPNAVFEPHPPNAAVPSAFHDGTIALLGEVTGLRIRDVFGLVTASATVRFVSGGSLADLDGDAIWSLEAAVSPFGGVIPPGYGANWSIELQPVAPVGVEDTSWGALKALYR